MMPTSHGRIEVQACAEDGMAVVSVQDDGIGIPGDMLPRVFEPFVQGAESEVRAQGGLGIGLTLVRSLVELHGGRVDAESAGSGHGARFVVRLPLALQVQVIERVPEATPPGASRRVLVVDDNQDAADSLAALLRMESHDVQVAYDGASAIELARRQPPEVVFLDIGMPGMDGHETARGLRRLPGMTGAKVVALTGWGQEQDRRRSALAGFDLHLVKPLDHAALLEVLAPGPT